MAMHVVVVGGGVTGLVAARKLRSRGVAVTLIDRGFPFGGRLRPSVAEIPGYGRAVFDPRPVFLGPAKYDGDHPDAPLGFPPLGLRPDEFAPETRAALKLLPVAHVGAGNGEPFAASAQGVTIQGGARTLIDLFIPRCDEHLELMAQTEVTALEPDGRGWRVRVRECDPPSGGDQRSRTVRADAVLLTQPIPDALALIDAGAVELPDALHDELRRVQYERTVTVTAIYRGSSQLPAGGAVSFSDSPLALVFDNRTTGASPTGPAITAVANADWAAEHWNQPDEEIGRRLLPLIAPWTDGELVWHCVQRREYDRATDQIRMPFAEASDVPPLVIAGDGFASYVMNPLDAAYTSATHAVTHLCRMLGREARIAGRRTPRTPSRTVVEVAVSSAAEATLAVENGADRLFLLAAPEVGGLTPSLDTFLAVRRVADGAAPRGKQIAVTVLLRPRLGDCEYDDGEVAQLRRDARRFLLVGADGIAFGALTARGGETRVDADACLALVGLAHARGKQAVFHRAFDALSDRRTGLQDLIALGFDRVITAGRWKLACDSASVLAADVAYAGWDIDVTVAGGIGPESVRYIIAETGCPGVLAGLRGAPTGRTNNPARVFGGHRPTAPAGHRVREIATVLNRAERDDELAGTFDEEFEADCESEAREEATAAL